MRLIPLKAAGQVGKWAGAPIVKRINEFQPTAERPLYLDSLLVGHPSRLLKP